MQVASQGDLCKPLAHPLLRGLPQSLRTNQVPSAEKEGMVCGVKISKHWGTGGMQGQNPGHSWALEPRWLLGDAEHL